MAKEEQKVIEAALNTSADKNIIYNDLETHELEKVVEFLEKQLKEAKELLDDFRKEDDAFEKDDAFFR